MRFSANFDLKCNTALTFAISLHVRVQLHCFLHVLYAAWPHNACGWMAGKLILEVGQILCVSVCVCACVYVCLCVVHV